MTTKTLKDLFEVYKPKSPDEQKFVDKHVTIKHQDRNGNGDDVFNATNVKTIERKKERKGYDPGEDEKVYEEVEEIDELSRATVGRYSMKAKSIADNEGGKDRSKGRELAGRKKWGGTMSGVKKARVPATEEVETDAETLEEGTMKLSKVHIVHHHDHPAAKEFAKHYTDAMKGDHREGGPTEKDEAASNKFHERYSGVRTREGFAGSGTHVYTDHKTGAKWKVDRHPNGKTFYGTDHIISHHTGPIHEAFGLEEGEVLDTIAEDRVLRSLVAYYEELGEEVLIEDILTLSEELINELSKRTLGAYGSKAVRQALGAKEKLSQSKRWAGINRASAKMYPDQYKNSPLKAKVPATNEEVENIDELSKATLGSYVKNAQGTILSKGMEMQQQVNRGSSDEARRKTAKKVTNRLMGVNKAVDRLTKEEVENIDELSKATLGSYVKKAKTQMSRSDTVSGRLAGERMKGGKPSAQERKHSDRANKRYFGIDKAVDRLTKEDVINLAIEKYATIAENTDLPTQEERLVSKLEGISESHVHLLLSLFESLDNDNKTKMLSAADTPEGINGLIDFAIESRGE